MNAISTCISFEFAISYSHQSCATSTHTLETYETRKRYRPSNSTLQFPFPEASLFVNESYAGDSLFQKAATETREIDNVWYRVQQSQ